MPIFIRLIYLCLLCAASVACMANGESSAFLANSGIIVPVTEGYVQVPDQRVTVTMPSPAAARRGAPAHIRVIYTLYNDDDKPLNIQVAWPTGDRLVDAMKPAR